MTEIKCQRCGKLGSGNYHCESESRNIHTCDECVVAERDEARVVIERVKALAYAIENEPMVTGQPAEEQHLGRLQVLDDIRTALLTPAPATEDNPKRGGMGLQGAFDALDAKPTTGKDGDQ